MLTICGTGHRPDKLGGYSSQVTVRLIDLATAYLNRKQPDCVISGCALGWDTALAIAAIRLNIPLTSAVPFVGFDGKWSVQCRKRFNKIASKSTTVVIVDTLPQYSVSNIKPGVYHPFKLQKRNEYMVDNSTRIVALWNGTPGGTANCLKYNEGRILVDNLWNSWNRYKGI